MLAYVFTDADVTPGALQAMLSKSVEGSFNAIIGRTATPRLPIR